MTTSLFYLILLLLHFALYDGAAILNIESVRTPEPNRSAVKKRNQAHQGMQNFFSFSDKGMTKKTFALKPLMADYAYRSCSMSKGQN
ncbi:hypothetical protein [Leifsonia shinshuensis]|uniref:hypothetical protein n=1 Tax=Leifsonia shinshuensis TaxID=150026 RepID=UPI0035E5147F